MKVVFLENVEGTAQVGDVKDVKNGFARNFLLPKGLAAPAIEPYLARAQAGAKREAKQQAALDDEAQALAGRLEGQRITMTARVGEQGKLYGSITAVHIAQEVATLIGAEEFDHRKVLLPEAIKETGVQPVRLRLTRNIEAAIDVEVLAEGVEEEDAPVAEDTEAENGESPESEDSPESPDSDSPDSPDSEDSPDSDDEG
jgi:large subunit ribosomal protein L9